MKKIISNILCAGMMILMAACSSNSEKKDVSDAVDGGLDSIVAADEIMSDNPADREGIKIVDNLIVPENVPAVVDFYADWCEPCKEYKPTFEKVKESFGEQAIFLSINVDKYKEIASAYGVESIPTTVFIQPGGQKLGQEAGIMTAEKLTAFVNQLISQNGQSEFSL